MRIVDAHYIPHFELCRRLRTVRLRGHGQAEVYRDASINVVHGAPLAAIRPAQKYILQPQIDRLMWLWREVKAGWGMDIFQLGGDALLLLHDNGVWVPLLPPIIEVEHVGTEFPYWICNDGMHRLWTAEMELDIAPTVLVVSGIDPKYPYYAEPLDGWHQVEIVDTVPEVKKTYREPDDYKALFRDFNAVFPGVQTKR